MAEYTVVVRITAGYLLKVIADSPADAAARVDGMSFKDCQTKNQGFFVNTDVKFTGNVWDEQGNIVLEKK